MSHRLRFRQIHLDFHTSPAISGIGKAFDADRYVRRLKEAHVDSITTFATCHHGWAYYQTDVVEMHPHLEFDLLKEQFTACKAGGINVPIYITAGVNNRAAELHPEWREVGPDGCYTGWAKSPLEAGFHKMCFNTPYLDHLCDVIRDVVRRFPLADGIFLDIISQGQCCCNWCIADMQKLGLDPQSESDRQHFAHEVVLGKYFEASAKAVRDENPDMPIFHNSGHIEVGSSDRLLKYFSHLELESLPTGGWGYDHFPMSARYVANLPLDFLGMTGKFHSTWGEFGGFKHPNALRYECAAMLAFGSKCSVGDQLHPSAELDEGTYRMIGKVYQEVEAKEPWCDDVCGIADVAVLSNVATNGEKHGYKGVNASDVGVCRLLLENHILFSVIDTEMDFSPYKAIILPDSNYIDEDLANRLKRFVEAGGKVLLTGKSGLKPDGSGFWFDIGADYEGESEFNPDFLHPREDLRPEITTTPFVSYTCSQRIKITDGDSLGDIHDPWFNRSYKHFSSHQHAPFREEPNGYALGVRKGGYLYLASAIFSQYRGYGAVVHKQFFRKCIDLLMGESKTIETNLPSVARVSLLEQESFQRYVLHLLYANTISRGGPMDLSGGNLSTQGKDVQVIEDLLPLHGVEVKLRLPKQPKRIYLAPEQKEIPFEQRTDGSILFTIDQFLCHQMVVVDY